MKNKKFANLQLADPDFHKPQKIDVILGADVIGDIMKEGIIPGNPLIQETVLGWILSGKYIEEQCVDEGNVACFMIKVNLDEQLKKFWELEDKAELPKK